ncbi:MAG: NtaA/DmoA family FMN-dependent monooxygenase [Gordonia sp. (in: high G+C Gram-positive bacteria)]
MTGRQIKLAWHFKPGNDWRSADGDIDDLYSAARVANVARTAEAALLDMLFQADTYEFRPTDAEHTAPRFTDPFSTLGAAAAVTERIGLVATASTTLNEPYALARQISTLDLLSQGRAGWNAVTSFKGFDKFGRDIPDPQWRYERADEFLDVVKSLWASWGDNSVIFDRSRGRFADSSAIADVDFAGHHLSVHGAGALPRSRQGQPVVFQAGASAEGLLLAAQHADAVFSASPDLIHATKFYRELKEKVRGAGRDEAQLLVFKGYNLTIAPTRNEARERFHSHAGTTNYVAARRNLESYLGGVDLSDIDLDDPLPLNRLPEPASASGIRSRIEIYRELAARPRARFRDVLDTLQRGQGHYSTWGSPDDITDDLIRWFNNRAADGFVLSFFGPGNQFTEFRDEVIPRLQDRGYFRRSYKGTTLRENLGLSPASSL